MRPIKILSYNVHGCVGTDRRLAPERVARVIEACGADIVALQELDVGRARSGHVDQAETIARLLGMQSHFHASTRIGTELYGDAVLTALPMTIRNAGPLPGFHDRMHVEPRGAIWASIEVDNGLAVQLVNTHLGVWPHEQMLQLSVLLGAEWLGHPDCCDPAIFLGDFNAPPVLAPYRRLAAEFVDVQTVLSRRRAKPTFPGRMPALRLDHVWLRGKAEVISVDVVRTALSRVASDHLPLLVEFDFGAAFKQETAAPETLVGRSQA